MNHRDEINDRLYRKYKKYMEYSKYPINDMKENMRQSVFEKFLGQNFSKLMSGSAGKESACSEGDLRSIPG